MDDEIGRTVLELLAQHRIVSIATLRPDIRPQATSVGYVNEGLTLCFLCGLDSQKEANLARDDRVSLTIDYDTPDIMAITGLSMAARACRHRAGGSGGGLANVPAETSRTGPAMANAEPGRSPHLPQDAYGRLPARLLPRFRAHGSGHLLSVIAEAGLARR